MCFLLHLSKEAISDVAEEEENRSVYQAIDHFGGGGNINKSIKVKHWHGWQLVQTLE